MNKQIELFKAGTPNVRVYVLPDQYDGVTVVWPYKSGFSSLTNDGGICEHFVSTDWEERGKVVYPNPLDSEGHKHLGKKAKWEDLPESVKQSILYLFPLVWDVKI